MNEQIPEKKRVHVFKNGRSRAIRIPKEFEFEGDEVDMVKEPGGKLTITPVKTTKGLLALLATMEPLPEEDWMPEIDDSNLPPLRDVEF